MQTFSSFVITSLMAAVRSDTGLELLTIGQPSSGNRQGVKNSVQIKDITGGIIDRNV